MLDDDAVFHHSDLGVAGAFVWRLGADLVAHDHRPLDGLAPSQEFGLAQDRRTAPARVAAIPTTLPLGLQPGRSADALDLAVAVAVVLVLVAARRALVHDGVGRIVWGQAAGVVVTRAGLAAATAAATAGAAFGACGVVVAGVVVGLVGLVVGILVVAFGIGFAVVTVLLATTTTTSSAPPATAPGGGTLGLLLLGVLSAVVAVVVLGV